MVSIAFFVSIAFSWVSTTTFSVTSIKGSSSHDALFGSKLASSPGSQQGAERNKVREPGIHCLQLVLYPWNFGDSVYSQYSLRVMNVSWCKLHVKREYGIKIILGTPYWGDVVSNPPILCRMGVGQIGSLAGPPPQCLIHQHLTWLVKASHAAVWSARTCLGSCHTAAWRYLSQQSCCLFVCQSTL